MDSTKLWISSVGLLPVKLGRLTMHLTFPKLPLGIRLPESAIFKLKQTLELYLREVECYPQAVRISKTSRRVMHSSAYKPTKHHHKSKALASFLTYAAPSLSLKSLRLPRVPSPTMQSIWIGRSLATEAVTSLATRYWSKLKTASFTLMLKTVTGKIHRLLNTGHAGSPPIPWEISPFHSTGALK